MVPIDCPRCRGGSPETGTQTFTRDGVRHRARECYAYTIRMAQSLDDIVGEGFTIQNVCDEERAFADEERRKREEDERRAAFFREQAEPDRDPDRRRERDDRKHEQDRERRRRERIGGDE